MSNVGVNGLVQGTQGPFGLEYGKYGFKGVCKGVE